MMGRKRYWITIGVVFGVFLFGMFVAGPLVQMAVEKHQPYILVDPDVQSETGCEYDYLSYIPVEITGRDPSEGVIFPVAEIPIEYADYVHYPESWDNPLNPFNPDHQLGVMIQSVGRILLCIISGVFIAYLISLWRVGKLKKMKDKLRDKMNEQD